MRVETFVIHSVSVWITSWNVIAFAYIHLSLVIGLQQQSYHWFSMPVGHLSLVTVGKNDWQGPTTKAQKCFNISAIVARLPEWRHSVLTPSDNRKIVMLNLELELFRLKNDNVLWPMDLYPILTAVHEICKFFPAFSWRSFLALKQPSQNMQGWGDLMDGLRMGRLRKSWMDVQSAQGGVEWRRSTKEVTRRRALAKSFGNTLPQTALNN